MRDAMLSAISSASVNRQTSNVMRGATLAVISNLQFIHQQFMRQASNVKRDAWCHAGSNLQFIHQQFMRQPSTVKREAVL